MAVLKRGGAEAARRGGDAMFDAGSRSHRHASRAGEVVTVTVKVPRELHRRLKLASVDTGESIQNIVASAISEYLESLHDTNHSSSTTSS